MTTMQIILMGIGLALGLGTVFVFLGQGDRELQEKTRSKIQHLLEDAKRKAREIQHRAKVESRDLKTRAHEENVRLEAHLKRLEDSVHLKEKHVNKRVQENQKVENEFKALSRSVRELKKGIEADGRAIVDELLDKTKLPKEQILDEVSRSLESEILSRKDKYVQKRVSETEEGCVKHAQNVLVTAIQKYADTSSVDRTVTTVTIKNEKFKPNFIGKQGEIIDYFEELIDVEVIFNDYPKTLTVGGYSVLKRQTAKEAIEILKKVKGPITKAHVDKAMAQATEAVDRIMIKKAKKACQKIGLKDVPEGLLRYIGRLHFRTSYGQNALKHCLEVGFFAGILAAEIGADVEVARIAGFFHDVGKAISEESDKGHDFLTKDILEEFDYPEPIIHAAWVHHEAEPAKTLEAKVVMAADALSASRPGARLESLERYLRRIRELEATASSFPGIKKTFAISAGREVRVIVKPGEVTDESMLSLARDIAQKIEDNLTYPGNVKVNVIRRKKWDAYVGKRSGGGAKDGAGRGGKKKKKAKK